MRERIVDSKVQMTIDDLTKLYIPENFGTDESDCGDTLEYIIDQIKCEYAYGVSKFVLFINDKEVVKIPFNGEYYWNYEAEDYVFEPFMTITDYCKKEATLYEKAQELGIAEFFAGTHLAGYTKDHTPFYISERINKTFDDVEVSAEQKESAKKYADSKGDISWRRLPVQWLALALEKFGVAKVDKFVNFIIDFDINDLHWGNVGLRDDGTPVLIDYSGWHD